MLEQLTHESVRDSWQTAIFAEDCELIDLDIKIKACTE